MIEYIGSRQEINKSILWPYYVKVLNKLDIPTRYKNVVTEWYTKPKTKVKHVRFLYRMLDSIVFSDPVYVCEFIDWFIYSRQHCAKYITSRDAMHLYYHVQYVTINKLLPHIIEIKDIGVKTRINKWLSIN